MNSATTLDADLVKNRFERVAPYWEEIYRQTDVAAAIVQQRHQITLFWVHQLGLSPGANVLELGCGTGRTAVALARHGFRVSATDVAASMLGRARRHAEEVGISQQLSTVQADAHTLPFKAGTFDLVVALGLTPWLRSPPDAMREVACGLAPGGYLIVHAANRSHLLYLVDPMCNPRLTPVKRPLRLALMGVGAWPARDQLRINLFSLREFDQLLLRAGFEKIASTLYGFGPATLFSRKVLSDDAGLRLNRKLQALAESGFPGLRSTAAEYLVLARKSTSL